MRLNVPCREVAASVFDFLAGDQSKCSTRLSNSAQLLGSESPVDSQMAIRPKRQPLAMICPLAVAAMAQIACS